MSKKSILEQALLQVETLEEVMKANAKGILSSTMKKEIKDMLKEEDEEEKEVEEPKTQETDGPEMEDETSSEDTDMEDEESDMEDETSDESDDETTDMPKFMNDETDDETLDLTNASDDEVIKVYKSLKPEDGVIVKKSGDDIKMKTDGEDYLIRLNDDEMESDEIDEDFDYDSPDGNVDEYKPWEDEEDEEDESHEEEEEESHEEDEEESHEEETNEDEDVYEIELDDEDETTSTEVEVDESARTEGFGYHGGIESKKMFKAGNKRNEINEEITKLKKQNAEYKKALILFKDKLNEVAVFNANLAYANKIISENTTTRQEKIEILKRFDNIENLNESKKLYETIKSELKNKKPVVESVANKIAKTPTTSTSKEVLTESKAYENPAFKRIKELMNKIN